MAVDRELWIINIFLRIIVKLSRDLEVITNKENLQINGMLITEIVL